MSEALCKLQARDPRLVNASIGIHSVAGTPQYLAPEVVRMLNRQIMQQQGQEASATKPSGKFPDFDGFCCDIWPLRVCIDALLHNGEHPYSIEDVSALLAEDQSLPALDFRCGQLPEDFGKQCLKVDFRSRPFCIMTGFEARMPLALAQLITLHQQLRPEHVLLCSCRDSRGQPCWLLLATLAPMSMRS